jgi:hypothetical protein
MDCVRSKSPDVKSKTAPTTAKMTPKARLVVPRKLTQDLEKIRRHFGKPHIRLGSKKNGREMAFEENIDSQKKKNTHKHYHETLVNRASWACVWL